MENKLKEQIELINTEQLLKIELLTIKKSKLEIKYLHMEVKPHYLLLTVMLFQFLNHKHMLHQGKLILNLKKKKKEMKEF
jgi:hypothetical protein